MRSVSMVGITIILGCFGCGSGQQAVESARAAAKLCETRTERPLGEHFAVKAHTPDGRTLETVTLVRGERLCLAVEEQNGTLGRLSIVESARGPSLGLTLTGSSLQPILWVNNQLPKALIYSATVRVKGSTGAFPTDACPVESGSVGELRWDDEIEEASLSDFQWSSSAEVLGSCG